jgi:hypothetical protein
MLRLKAKYWSPRKSIICIKDEGWVLEVEYMLTSVEAEGWVLESQIEY